MTTHFEQILKSAVKNGSMTRAGADWLTLALDPEHHKNPCTQVGFPDGTKANNLIRTVNEQEHFIIPSNVGSDTWHAAVFSIPELCQKNIALAQVTNHVVNVVNPWTLSDGITPIKWGLFNAVFAPTTITLFPTDFTVPFTYPAGTIVYNSNYSQYCEGLSRFVGGSFKVCNTSTVGSLGGAGTAFRVPAQAREISWSYQTTGSAASMTTGSMNGSPPSTTSDAYKIPGSIAFDLKDGVYMPLILNSPPDTGYCRYQQEFLVEADLPNTPVDTYVRAEYTAAGATVPLGGARTAPYPCTRTTQTDICGSYMTGLQPGMQFTLFTKVFIETFPSPHNSDITLSRAAAPYDEVAWDLYRATVKRLPAYATFDSNDSSKWWDVVCAAGFVASRVIPHPLFAALVMPTIKTIRTISENPTEYRGYRSRGLATLASDAQRKASSPAVVSVSTGANSKGAGRPLASHYTTANAKSSLPGLFGKKPTKSTTRPNPTSGVGYFVDGLNSPRFNNRRRR